MPPRDVFGMLKEAFRDVAISAARLLVGLFGKKKGWPF